MNKIMTVYRAPGNEDEKPQIKISNKYLVRSGFFIGDRVIVSYAKNSITVSKQKINNQ